MNTEETARYLERKLSGLRGTEWSVEPMMETMPETIGSFTDIEAATTIAIAAGWLIQELEARNG